MATEKERLVKKIIQNSTKDVIYILQGAFHSMITLLYSTTLAGKGLYASITCMEPAQRERVAHFPTN
jgi:hypothetical protein